ncbi:D,D-heptose 7-phosphate kinase [hydrothermal vent metagenome]|uniref:D,D-heptose 7-phosphate kinase n=1 Tax=hydrothermal vent metagenome TaxID=652676 RepID=A0A3B1CNR9_9ZZZZ
MSSLKKVIATAPTRIDLAGGTLDIWPLNVFFDNPVTVNMAIDIKVYATVISRKDRKVVLTSEDLKKRVEFKNIESVHHRHALGLLSRLATFFIMDNAGVEITTKSNAPSGAGLAGSSALNIALCGALSKFTGTNLRKDKLINVAKDVEAALLGVPTGLQDYGAAVYGGVNAFHFPLGGMEREKLADRNRELEKSILLFYSGASRSSGINNWEMMKRVIAKDKKTIHKFVKISECAKEVVAAIKAGNIADVEKAVDMEWKARKALFPQISTKTIDLSITAGKRAGAKSARICGAGGGGCFFLMAEPELHQKVISSVERFGAKNLSFKTCKSGLKLYN